MLETKCVDDKFQMLVTDSGPKVANIMILQPTSEISHYHKVTNITMSLTSLSTFIISLDNILCVAGSFLFECDLK